MGSGPGSDKKVLLVVHSVVKKRTFWDRGPYKTMLTDLCDGLASPKPPRLPEKVMAAFEARLSALIAAEGDTFEV